MQKAKIVCDSESARQVLSNGIKNFQKFEEKKIFKIFFCRIFEKFLRRKSRQTIAKQI